MNSVMFGRKLSSFVSAAAAAATRTTTTTTTPSVHLHPGAIFAHTTPISASLLNCRLNVSLPPSRRRLSHKPGDRSAGAVESCKDRDSIGSVIDSCDAEGDAFPARQQSSTSSDHLQSSAGANSVNNMMSGANRIPKLTQPIVECSQNLATTPSQTTLNQARSYKDAALGFFSSSLHRFTNQRQLISSLADQRLSGNTLLGFVQRNVNAIVTARPLPLLLSNITTRFTSTVSDQQKPMEKGKSSGEPIVSEGERLIAGSKGNKRININVCGELYSELAESNPSLYSHAPKRRGIDLSLEYYDTGELLDPIKLKFSPTICLLHGAPGRYEDFASLINHLTRLNVRVIAPNFPDYSATFEHSFRHSPRERADVLTNFFQKLNINQLDMLIGHSSAVYTMFELLHQGKISVKSLGLFSTPTYNLPPQLEVTPVRLFALKLFDYTFLRPIIVALMATFAKLQGIQNRVDKDRIDNLLIAASAVGYSNCDNMSERLRLVHKLKIPTYVLVGGNDRLIPMTCFDQLKRDLGIKGVEQIRLYDGEGKLTSSASDINELVEVSEFTSGGHYAFQRFSKQVNEDVSAFLRRKGILKNVSETTKL